MGVEAAGKGVSPKSGAVEGRRVGGPHNMRFTVTISIVERYL